MYAKIKEEIKQAYYAQNFPNDGQRFVAWYLRNIHLRDMNEANKTTPTTTPAVQRSQRLRFQKPLLLPVHDMG